jgi:uncharacterized protein YegP (UPF0339 family)
MPQKALVIPIKIDALLVSPDDEPLAEAKVNFGRLPFNNGKEDVNSEFAFISENFLSQPFQNNNLVLKPGVHLHWALPDAFMKGEMGTDSEYNESEPTLSWIKQEGTENHAEPNALTTDSKGNVFICGTFTKIISSGVTIDNVTNLVDIFLIKLNGIDGQQLWIRQLGTNDGEQPFGIVTDTQGDVFICGYTSGEFPNQEHQGVADVFLAKFSGVDGQQIWLRQFGTNVVDLATAITTDSHGNVFFSGYTEAILDDDQTDPTGAFLAKFSGGDGRKVWIKRVGIQDRSIVANAIAIDALDNIFVCGQATEYLEINSEPSNKFDAFLAKFSGNDGTRHWIKEMEPSELDLTRANAIAVDLYGNVFISGIKTNSNEAENSYESFLVKFSGKEGQKIWVKHLDAIKLELANSIASDSKGNVYVSGHVQGKRNPNNQYYDYNAIVAKFSGIDGTTRWIRQVGTVELDAANTIAIDSQDNIFISGFTFGVFEGEKRKGSQDVFVAKFSHPPPVTHSPIPDRWKINRKNKDGEIEKSWIVESNYLHPEGRDNRFHSIAYPIGIKDIGQPFRYMGRSYCFYDKNTPGTFSIPKLPRDAGYLQGLTAVGYGEHTFVAFYPNCHSVFGFHDPEIKSKEQLNDYTYEVLGWYSDPIKNDPLQKGNSSYSGSDLAAAALKKQFNFDLKNAKDFKNTSISPTSLCFGQLKFQNVEDSPDKNVDAIAIGNTGTEALSALLADNISKNAIDKKLLEAKLEALQLLSKVGGKKLDIDAAFEEAYHEKGFSTVNGGHIWSLHLISVADPDKANKGKKQGAEITLPDSFGHWLNKVNQLQHQHDRALDELKSLQELLYSDWCKYMISAYHSDIEKGLPHVDEVRFFIENNSIPEVKKKQEEIQEIQLQINEELSQIKQLVAQFNAGLRSSSKLLTEKYFYPNNKTPADGVRPDETTSADEKDPALEGVFIKKFDGTEEGEILELTADGLFNALSFWINISSHQPLDPGSKEPYARELLKFSDPNTPAIIDTNGIDSYWQSVYINGQAPDPYQVLQWKDFPKDQWVHVYLRGSSEVSLPINIVLMNGLKGSLAGVRVYHTGLTATEVFCDQNMFLLKELKLVNDKGPRYWQPNEPVVLISGDIAQPTDRHGSDGDLPCLLLDYGVEDVAGLNEIDNLPLEIKEMLKKTEGISANIYSKGASFDHFKNAVETIQTTDKPWNPIILEWKVGMIPLADNKGIIDYTLPADLITGHYILESDKPDLIPFKPHTHSPDSMQIFTGSTILSPHAKIRLKKVIEQYLKNLHEDSPDWGNYNGNKQELLDLMYENLLKAKQVLEKARVKRERLQKLFEVNAITELEKLEGENRYEQAKKEVNLAKEKITVPVPTKLTAPDYTVLPNDTISIALKAYHAIDEEVHFLSQSFGGFNAALQMLHQTFQLPIADPIGFKDDQAFAAMVKTYVQNASTHAPLPLFEFDPIRTGRMKLLELSIIDTFGQIRKVYDDGESNKPPVVFSRTLEDGRLPPRIAQPVRLNFRWLSAQDDDMEMNDHPVSSPVCGWLVPNNIDRTIMVYDQHGHSLGAIHPPSKATEPVPAQSKTLSNDPSPTVAQKPSDDYKPMSFFKARENKPQTGFDLFRDDGGEYYFTYNLRGVILLISEGYKSSGAQENGKKSVEKNMAIFARYKRMQDPQDDSYFFVLRAGNYREIARSKSFATAEEMEEIIKELSGGPYIKASPEAHRGPIDPISSFNQYPNKHLKAVVEKIAAIKDLPAFMDLLEKTMDEIDPENFAQHTDLAILMGRPIAVVRASVGLDIKGNPAVNQNWDSFIANMTSFLEPGNEGAIKRTTNDWEKVKFPVRIGEHGQLNDGVLGFWLDDSPEKAFLSTVPADDEDISIFLGEHTHSRGYVAQRPNIELSLADTPKRMTLLMDPRGQAHGTCGILPAKLIAIPDDQFKPALKNMSVTFFTRPLLMPMNKLTIPLPKETGYSWSWLEKRSGRWREFSTIGIVHKESFTKAFRKGAEIWAELLKKGWIEETENHKARVIPQNQRKDPTPGPLLVTQLNKIQDILDAGHIIDEVYEPNFSQTNRIKEGWLKLTPNK